MCIVHNIFSVRQKDRVLSIMPGLLICFQGIKNNLKTLDLELTPSCMMYSSAEEFADWRFAYDHQRSL